MRRLNGRTLKIARDRGNSRMARLHGYQGKEILAENGFKVPRGKAANPAEEAAAKELGGEVLIKIEV